jgi:hypothetical protein
MPSSLSLSLLFLHFHFHYTHSLSFLRLSAVLREGRLDDDGAVALAEALKTNTHLKRLE